jgi:hypothetical protein
MFTGVAGASLETFMKLDIANSMAMLLADAISENSSIPALEEFYKSSSHEVCEFIDVLIQWIFLNKSGTLKSTPVAAKIFNLSATIERILATLQVDNN